MPGAPSSALAQRVCYCPPHALYSFWWAEHRQHAREVDFQLQALTLATSFELHKGDVTVPHVCKPDLCP